MKRKNITTEMMKDYMVEALILLLEKKPYHEITIKEITDKAGVNRSTYYRNFNSKEEIMKRFYCKILNDGFSNIKDPDHISVEQYLTHMFQMFWKHKEVLLIIHHNSLSYLLLDALRSYFSFRKKYVYGTFAEKLPMNYHIGGIFNNFLLWFDYGMEATPEEFTKAALLIYPPDRHPML